MAYRPLVFSHPHDWLKASPSRRWNKKARCWVYRPKSIEGLAQWYTADMLGALDAHALRWLNAQHWPDDDSVATLTRDLRQQAIAAGARVGVTFHGERATDSSVMAGALSLAWLERAAADAAIWSLEQWDPEVARLRHERAVRMGRGSHLKLTPADLEPLAGMSIAKQAAALGCSRRKISYLRGAAG